jgi:hypothetical protein
MLLRTFFLTWFLCAVVLASEPDSSTGWMQDRPHPQVQYRFLCFRGSLTIEWRSSYPGAVTLKANVKSSGYDGDEHVVIAPGGSATSSPETLNCSAESFQITEKRFSMAAPPPPPAPAAGAKSDQPKEPVPPLPTVAPWIPPAKLVELAPAALASIHVGMKREEVLRTIGNPMSKLAIPDENELVETYRYPVSPGRTGIVRLSNGTVTEAVVQ